MTSTLSNDKLTLNAASPGVEFTGTEGSADPFTFRENAGYAEIYDQSGAAATAKFKVSDGGLTIVGAGNITMAAASAGTFTTGTGAVTLNGDVTVASGKDITMSGASTFATGTGAVSLNGTTTVATGKTLAVTDVDALTVSGIIVPQYKDFRISLDANSVTQVAFICHDKMELHAISYAHVVGSTSGVMQIRNCTSGQAAAAGATMLVAPSTIDMSTALAANTPASYTPHGTAANIQVLAGSMVQLEISGTMTGLVGGCLTLTFKRVS